MCSNDQSHPLWNFFQLFLKVDLEVALALQTDTPVEPARHPGGLQLHANITGGGTQNFEERGR